MSLRNPICGVILLLFGVVTYPCFGQVSTDFFDVTQTTITVSSHTSTIFGSNDNTQASDTVYNIFGATASNAPEANDRMLFADFTGTAFVNFTRSGTNAFNTLVMYNTSDGGVEDANRGVQSFSLFADSDTNGSYETVLLTNADPVDDGAANYYVIPTNTFTNFRAEFTPPGPSGSRIVELDATFDPLASNNQYRNRDLLNATTNVLAQGDERPGRVNSVIASSAVGGDTPVDAFGNNNGTVEPSTFIFSDVAEPQDIVPQTLDFTTNGPVTLTGIALSTGADTGEDGYRGTSLFRFFADVNNNGFGDDLPLISANPTDDNQFDFLYFTSSVTASSFRAEFTASSVGGPRVLEIDALVPEPDAIALLMIGGAGLLRRRRR